MRRPWRWLSTLAAVAACSPFGAADPSDGGTAESDAGVGADGSADADTGAPDDCLALGPAAFYRFDEGSSDTVRDATSHGSDGRLVNGTARVPGARGGALSFDGVDDYVEIPSTASIDVTSAVSITFFLYAGDVSRPNDGVIVGKRWDPTAGAAVPYQYGVELNASTKDLQLFFGEANAAHGPFSMRAPLGRWAHVAFAYDGARVRGWIDGVVTFDAPTSGSLASTENPLRLGVDGQLEQPFFGKLDELCIFARGLTTDEVRRLAGGR